MVRTRFAPWSKQGVIFGIPHDLHPVTITYRKDLFDQANIDIASAKTWDQFQDLALQFQEHYRNKGVQGRFAIELPAAASDYLVVMLLQRRLNAVDDFNRVHLNNPKVTDTLARYALMVAGPRRIGADATPGGELYARDLARGDLCALVTPDWRAGFLYARCADIAGSLAMMPLPRFDPTDAPTSTWGGTMMGIPRTAKDPEASWALLKRLYISDESLNARQRINRILPPVREQWKNPVFHIADPFFSNQMVDELFIELAEQIPPRYVTAFTPIGSQSLNMVLADAVQYVKNHAAEPRAKLEAGLRSACQKWLDHEADILQKRIEFGKFE
jgi:arabinosaccharide transport system substrate-binding protein